MDKANKQLLCSATIFSGCANPPNLNSTALLDTAANISLLANGAPSDRANMQLTPKSVMQPKGERLLTTETLLLHLNKLPLQAREAHRAPGITNNLISASALADAGCEIFFHKTGCEVSLNGEIILRGWRDPDTRLWRVSLHSDGSNRIVPADQNIIQHMLALPPPEVNSIYECENTGQLINFYYATMGYPVISTWTKAIDKGYFRGWRGLTSDRVRRFIKPNEQCEQGHMDQRRTGIRSTKSSRASPPPDTINTMEEPEQAPQNDKTNMVFMTIAEAEGQLFTDQTGRFPVTSNKGNNYIVLFYVVDANFIKSYPIKSRHRTELLKAYDEVYKYLRIRGYRPKLHRLDNETSKDVEDFIAEQNAKHQYTPPDIHRTNIAERMIRTWKNHMCAVRAGTPKTYRLSNWCKDLEQVDITINMMRPCTQNPNLSAYEAMEGMFSFDATPMAPIGTECMIHVKPSRRHTWGYHSMKAWYFAPALKHYRCIKVVTDAGAVRITDTFKFLHHTLPTPTVSATDRIVKATQNLRRAIDGNTTTAPDELQAIETLRALILGTPQPPPLPESPVPPVPPPQADEIDLPAPEPILEQPSAQPVQTGSPRSTPSNRPGPHAIPFDEDELDTSTVIGTDDLPSQQRYNLRSQARHIIHSAIADGLVIPKDHIAFAVIDEESGKALEYRDLIKLDKYKDVWSKSYANELGRLTQGVRDIPGTNTMFFIHKSEIPEDRRKDITYGRIVVVVRPQKKEQERTRLTVGGNLIDYPWEVATPTADLTTAKLLFNSVISTPGAVFVVMDCKNFYLMTPMKRPEFMRLQISLIPDEIIEKYNLKEKVDDRGWVYVRIEQGMYGLPQAGRLANELLAKRLDKEGYYQCQYTPGLWRHKWRPITFSLVVDDFGIKTIGLSHAKHLKNVLEKYYEVTVDWKGELFCGVKLDWDYKNRTVDLSMPDYIPKALTRFQHDKPSQPQHAPYKSAPIQYGEKVQLAQSDKSSPEHSPTLSADKIKHIQQIVGTLLYYSRAVDPTLAAALSTIASQQSHGTQAVMDACHQLLDYVATHPNATIRYCASDMILALDTDGSYLSEPGAKSRAAAYFYLTKKDNPEFHNGSVLILSAIIKHIMASASETELAALFYGCKEAIPLRNTLEEMGHPQPGPTPVTTDNSTAIGLTMDTMTPKASKSMDMRFQWLKSRRAQQLFRYLWAKGTTNRADYPSKHHSAAHHQRVRPLYVYDRVVPQ